MGPKPKDMAASFPRRPSRFMSNDWLKSANDDDSAMLFALPPSPPLLPPPSSPPSSTAGEWDGFTGLGCRERKKGGGKRHGYRRNERYG